VACEHHAVIAVVRGRPGGRGVCAHGERDQEGDDSKRDERRQSLRLVA
jgi:hypothetical protein